MHPKKLLIAGAWIETSEYFAVRNPYSGEMIAEVCSAVHEDLDRSLFVAKNVVPEMERLSRWQLSKGLKAISEGILCRKDELARTITLEAAKPMIYSRGEVERAAATFAWAAGEAERSVGEIVPVDTQPSGRGKWARAIRKPRGVVYGITPFNFPLNLVAHKVAPALASRNAVIIKPSPRTPLTALLLGEIFLESGLPAEALQIVPTDVENIDLILQDQRVSMVSFTGSAAVGWDLKKRVGKKAVALELGGNAPVIVDETADVEKSVSRCVTGAFAYSGQVCISVQRILLHEQVAESWCSRFVEIARDLKKGDPMDDDTRISVMIDEASALRAESWLKEAVNCGAKLLCGGHREGSFLEPSLVSEADPELRVVSEEVFAPIAVVETYSDLIGAIESANNSKYGLQASVFSNSKDNIELAAESLEYAGIIINDAPIFRVDNMPYGGIKDSGFGREGVRYAMDEMSEIRLVVYEK